jgi:hypothetical protein
MVRIRVLFLEPGNLIHPSELDDGITEYCIKEGRQIYGEDYADFSVYRINSAALADSLRIGHELSTGEMLSTPNDPCVEMLVPMVVVYFDLLEINSDWHSPGGGVGWTVDSIGIFETFHEDFDTLVKHAKTLLGNKNVHRDEYGTKVQFDVIYEYSDWTDYWGEWDSEHNLLGVVGQIEVVPFGAPKKPQIETVEDVFSDAGASASSSG